MADSSKRPKTLTTEQWIEGVVGGDRTVLGRAITLVESNAPAHQEQAQELLQALIPRAGLSIRLGITGTPGAGKSTFIETLGCDLVNRGSRVAVLAVDPSSSISRGSILGDKTRMEKLGRLKNAFIRPSPTGGTLGGVARKTRESMVLFEAAGYDVLIVETVGVGQNEFAVRSLVDFFLLLLAPAGGDDLQGIKRGVMELADAVVVNKADGDHLAAANRAKSEYANALRYIAPATKGWETRAFTVSAVESLGIDTIWEAVTAHHRLTRKSGVFEERRRGQARDWLHQLLAEGLKDLFYGHPDVAALLPGVEQEILEGSLPAVRGAKRLLTAFEKAEKRRR